MRLKGDDEVVSMSMLHRIGDDRGARRYLKRRAVEAKASARRRYRAERMAEFEAAEEFILTVCANGYGKRSSAYEYRRTNRGGQGITNIDNLPATARSSPPSRPMPASNDAGHRSGQDDPDERRRHPRHRPQQRRRAPVQRRRERACRLCRAGSRRAKRRGRRRISATARMGRLAPSDDAVVGEDLADGGEGDDQA